MTERIYPRTAWVLTPSFRPRTVVLERPYSTRWEVTPSGKLYDLDEIFPTKEEAVADGWRRVGLAQASLDKRAATLDKKRGNLTKAAA